MSLNIIRGIKTGPTRAVIYGTEGIGKSTLAAQAPDVLIIDTEDGTGQIDAARVIASDWRAIDQAVKELIADHQGFRTIVIDTADWLERALIDHMLKQSGKKSIEDFGYGKGYTILQEHMARFLGQVDRISAKGIHVVFVAHAKVTRTSPPDQTDGFDRYELKLTKQVSPILKEWADLVLFCNYRIQMVEGTDGRIKAQGGKDRVMYATHSAAWDAKNRYGLADEMPMEFEQIAHLFGDVGAKATEAPESAAVAATEAAVVSDPATIPTLATPEQVAELQAWRQTPKGAELIEAALDRINGIEIGDLTAEQATELIAFIKPVQAERAATPGQAPSHIAAWLDGHAPAVNSYLERVKWINPGQTWRNLPDERMHSLIDKADKFARAAGIPALGERKAA